MLTMQLVWRTGQLSLLLLALASFCLCACGTMASLQEITPQSDPALLYYSGIRLDAKIILEETLKARIVSVAFRTLDFPLSFACDTVLLPFHAWSHIHQTINPPPAVQPEAGIDPKAEVNK